MWRSGLLGVVVAGVLAGCNATSEAPATANSTPIGSGAPATVGELASVKTCLRGAHATVTAESATRWKVGFADGHSVVVRVPKAGQRSFQSVLFGGGISGGITRELQVFVACYRKVFG
jgi:hypothetical protein